ncbi:BPSS1187 family protein [Haloferula chungangensis]|uniref:BPSS1187 family protein n=1 Tax=Haloferula chungangensis TaxID=1048331 RepID=A0ABW2L5N2_9BACT
MNRLRRLSCFLCLISLQAHAEEKFLTFEVRASEVDSRAREHPEIGYVFGTKEKPQDIQTACVDTRVPSKGQLVIWLMAPSQPLFERTTSYGLHSIQVHYARAWFGTLYGGSTPPDDDLFLSKVRLEAATGEDFSKAIDIPKPDGMMERALQFVLWLDKKNPEGKWGQFIAPNGKELIWDKVIIAGSSHGSTTAARFAKHKKVARVVMFAGPRDQYDMWQQLPSATPPERYLGFSHVLDQGWKEDHYSRSWQLLGLQKFGPVLNIDTSVPPYQNSRRLISDADVGSNPDHAHNSVIPGSRSPKDKQGKFLYEEVWRYLFTHPVDQVGKAVPVDPHVRMNQRTR